jgi:AcrR family transcriptional regulator
VTAVRSIAESPVGLRKRGATLERAILDAVWAELSEVGYTAFTVEGVAARARTGKASIYRRWPTKQELVMDAMLERVPTPEQCGIGLEIDDSVSTAEALHGVARAIASVITSPAGDAMRAIKCEALADPELARLIDDRFQAPRRAAMIGLLQRGAARGEVRPDAVTALVADVLPAILSHRVILQREPLTEQDLTDIMQQVFIPLIEVR